MSRAKVDPDKYAYYVVVEGKTKGDAYLLANPHYNGDPANAKQSAYAFERREDVKEALRKYQDDVFAQARTPVATAVTKAAEQLAEKIKHTTDLDEIVKLAKALEGLSDRVGLSAAKKVESSHKHEHSVDPNQLATQMVNFIEQFPGIKAAFARPIDAAVLESVAAGDGEAGEDASIGEREQATVLPTS